MNPNLFLVGGAIRDRLLNLKVKDFDFSCEASSYEEMKEFIISKNWDIKVEKPEYFTIRAVCPKLGGVDIVLCRKDGNYSDCRRPDSVEIGTIYDDLARRDFSSGAIAENWDTKEIIDPFNGIEDIKNRILKCVGDPQKRFGEDALRICRALRLSVTKSFSIDKSVQKVLNNYQFVKLLDNISAERIREELFKMFSYNTLRALKMLDEYPLIKNAVLDDEKFGIWLKPTMEKK